MRNNMQRIAIKICAFGLGALIALTALRAQIQAPDLLPDPQEMVRIEASVDRALKYLLQRQNPDGSWPSSFGRNNGVNAVCLLAFLGRGHVPGRGPYRHVVDRAMAFILATQAPNGLYASPNPSHGPMYEHALTTLAMIEAYGFVPDPGMRRSLQRAIVLIVKAQNGQGGWRYQPVPQDADLSVTVMQIVALRAAMNARFEVPESTLERAVQYVQSCVVKRGGFAYQPGGGPSPARTAAGVLSLQLLGKFNDPAVKAGLAYLQSEPYDPGKSHFWYMNYYAMQAYFQAGGEGWARWHPKVRQFLLARQNPDGSWPGYAAEKYNGPAKCYSTAFGAMCLEVYMHYLPAYQR